MDYRTKRKLRETEIARQQRKYLIQWVVLGLIVIATAIIAVFVIKDYIDTQRCMNATIGAEFNQLNCSEVLDLK